jgi:hypothetical protein
MMEKYSRKIAVVLVDGSLHYADIDAEEVSKGSSVLYKISLRQENELKVAESEENFFDALQKLRIEFEKAGTLLCCFGASENVYPSPMQKSMGPAVLAYKTELGRQAYSSDIVNIFDMDDNIIPSTVNNQEVFNKKWLNSIK